MSGFSPKCEELKKSSPHYLLKAFSDFAVVLPLLLLLLQLQFVACLDFFCGLDESHVDSMTTLPIGPPVGCAEQIHP
jgi:hypothetical protein